MQKTTDCVVPGRSWYICNTTPVHKAQGTKGGTERLYDTKY